MFCVKNQKKCVWLLFCWDFSSWNCSSWMENVWAGPNSCEEQHVPLQRCKLTTHTSVSVSGSSFFQEVKSVHLKIPPKKILASETQSYDFKKFQYKNKFRQAKIHPKTQRFCWVFFGRPVKAQASLNQQNAFQASKMSRFEVTVSSHATSCFPAVSWWFKFFVGHFLVIHFHWRQNAWV